MKFVDKNTIIFEDGSFFIIKKFGEVEFYPTDTGGWKQPNQKPGKDHFFKFQLDNRRTAIRIIKEIEKNLNL